MYMQKTLAELNRTLYNLKDRMLFLEQQANASVNASLALQEFVRDKAKVKSEENAEAVTLITGAEAKLDPEVTAFEKSMKALNATVHNVEANIEVASNLAKLEKRVDSITGIFALMRPQLSALKRRVDRMNDTLAGNFSDIVYRVVDKVIRTELTHALHNATEIVRLFDAKPNSTNARTVTNATKAKTPTKKSFLEQR